MHGRLHPLTPSALFLGLLVLLAGAGPAAAHQLVVDCRVLAGNKVQVEGWYNSPTNSHAAADAEVQAFGPGGQVLAEGRLDAKGFFTFLYQGMEPLKVVVYQAGHRGEVTIPASALAQTSAGTPPPATDNAATVPTSSSRGGPASITISSADRDSQEWLKSALIGIAFLLAVAAFVLSIRNAQRLRELTRKEKPLP